MMKAKEVRLGYDTKLWMGIEAQIRDTDQQSQTFSRIALPSPVKGKRKYSHCCQLQTDIHRPMANREWDA